MNLFNKPETQLNPGSPFVSNQSVLLKLNAKTQEPSDIEVSDVKAIDRIRVLQIDR